MSCHSAFLSVQNAGTLASHASDVHAGLEGVMGL